MSSPSFCGLGTAYYSIQLLVSTSRHHTFRKTQTSLHKCHATSGILVRLKFLTFVLNIQVFWDSATCQTVNSYRHFRHACCPHLQGLAWLLQLFTKWHSIISQKIWIFSCDPYFTSVKATNQTRHETKYEMLSITICYLPTLWLCYIHALPIPVAIQFNAYFCCTRLLASRVHTVLTACMFVSCVCCEGIGLCNGLITHSQDSYYQVCVCVWYLETSTMWQPNAQAKLLHPPKMCTIYTTKLIEQWHYFKRCRGTLELRKHTHLIYFMKF